MSDKGSGIGNVAIGLAVAVLGFIVYKSMFSGAVAYTGTAPTATQTSNASNPAALAASIMAATKAASSIFGTTSSSAGSLNSYLGIGTSTSGGMDQVYTSAAYNPDAISADIGSDTSAAMASSGESYLDSWGFTL